MRTVPLGLACVAQALKQAGHDVEILDLMDVAEVSESLSGAVRRVRPEAIGISLRNIDDQNMGSAHSFFTEANAIIREVKSLSSAPVILGGAGYSIFPESALERLGRRYGHLWRGRRAVQAAPRKDREEAAPRRHTGALRERKRAPGGLDVSSETSTGCPFLMAGSRLCREVVRPFFPSRPGAAAPSDVPTVPPRQSKARRSVEGLRKRSWNGSPGGPKGMCVSSILSITPSTCRHPMPKPFAGSLQPQRAGFRGDASSTPSAWRRAWLPLWPRPVARRRQWGSRADASGFSGR